MSVDQDVIELIDKYKDVLGEHYPRLKDIVSKIPHDQDVDEVISVHMTNQELRDILSRLHTKKEDDAKYLADIFHLAKEHKEDERSLKELAKILKNFAEKHNDAFARDLAEQVSSWIDAIKVRKRPLIAYLYTIEEGSAKPDEESPQKLVKLFNKVYTLFGDYDIYPEHQKEVERGRSILRRFGERFEMYGLGKVYTHWMSRHRVK